MNKTDSIFGLAPAGAAPEAQAPASVPRSDDHADPVAGAAAPEKPRRSRSRRSRRPAAETLSEGQGRTAPPGAQGSGDGACHPDGGQSGEAGTQARSERGKGGRRARQPKAPKPVVIPLAPVREGAEIDEQYLRSFTTEEIGVLPLTAFVGKIIFVECDRQLHQAMKVLLDEDLLGFDTETRPIFRKGAIPPPALLQLCGSKNVYIFQLAKLNDKAVLAELLSAKHIIKTGVSVRDDLKGLREHFEFTEHGFVDLGDVAKKMNMLTHGLRNLTANLMGLRISKGAQCSNWAREALSTKQIVYAATDAWISRELYLRFVDLGVL